MLNYTLAAGLFGHLFIFLYYKAVSKMKLSNSRRGNGRAELSIIHCRMMKAIWGFDSAAHTGWLNERSRATVPFVQFLVNFLLTHYCYWLDWQRRVQQMSKIQLMKVSSLSFFLFFFLLCLSSTFFRACNAVCLIALHTHTYIHT